MDNHKYLVQRRCNNKVAYPEWKARLVAKQMSKKFNEWLIGYECFDCGSWHVGHAQEDQKRQLEYEKRLREARSVMKYADPRKAAKAARKASGQVAEQLRMEEEARARKAARRELFEHDWKLDRKLRHTWEDDGGAIYGER